jgi:hypothetical protein
MSTIESVKTVCTRGLVLAPVAALLLARGTEVNSATRKKVLPGLS